MKFHEPFLYQQASTGDKRHISGLFGKKSLAQGVVAFKMGEEFQYVGPSAYLGDRGAMDGKLQRALKAVAPASGQIATSDVVR